MLHNWRVSPKSVKLFFVINIGPVNFYYNTYSIQYTAPQISIKSNHALYGQIQYNIHNIKNKGSIIKGSIFPNSQSSHIWDDLATMLDPCWIKKVTPWLRPLDNNRVTPIPVFPGAHCDHGSYSSLTMHMCKEVRMAWQCY